MGRLAWFFSFKGRLGRLAFWPAYLFLLVLFAIVWVGALKVGIYYSSAVGDWLELLVIPILIAIVAVVVRRLHDRGKSGWWAIPLQIAPAMLLAFANYLMCCGETTIWSQACVVSGSVLGAWGAFEIGILGSKPGANRYGA